MCIQYWITPLILLGAILLFLLLFIIYLRTSYYINRYIVRRPSQLRNLCSRNPLKDALVDKDESHFEQCINLSLIKLGEEKKDIFNYYVEAYIYN
jgi:hypothetical protein